MIHNPMNEILPGPHRQGRTNELVKSTRRSNPDKSLNRHAKFSPPDCRQFPPFLGQWACARCGSKRPDKSRMRRMICETCEFSVKGYEASKTGVISAFRCIR